MAELSEDTALRRFLLGLAEGMLAAEDGVDRVGDTMSQVARAYGHDEVDFFVLPTLTLVETGGGESSKIGFRSSSRAKFRFDQIAALYELIEQAKQAAIDPRAGIDRLNEIGAMKMQRHWISRVFGHAVLTTGLALLLAPTWQGALVAFGLGTVLGFAKLIRSPTLQLVFPVVAAFVSALAVFLIAPVIELGDPIRLMIAPLATFLPGGALTTAVMELAAGQMVAGASRLVMGMVTLGLLSFGIIAAGTLIGVGSSSYVPLVTTESFPWWAAPLGLICFAVGNFLHFGAPARTFWWVFLVIIVAYFGQTVGELIAGQSVNGFIGGFVVAPVVLWIAGLKHGAPSQLTFLPAFWLLVPGAAGLVGLTEAIQSPNGATDDFVGALVSIMSIAIGVLVGTAVFRFARHGAEEVANFHVDVPALHESERPPLWARFVPGTPRSFWGRPHGELPPSSKADGT
ncbi:threonine/serine exporter family protein [Agromyces intestinalis]|uniref:Threonine/serine exporter family protein n=1 Tax=Agromyces intestinalis TaxID=2592652 RepID=A0A5C1YH35_9MICO|nr:threonine/serine exporter family protein [Agromyces intestinalis]QEO14720.1 threonine/serine exporter family protein [Agromyces intestinalis]